MKQNIFKYTGLALHLLKDVILHFPTYVKKGAHTVVIFSSFFLILIFFIITLCIRVLRKIPVVSMLVAKCDPLWNRLCKPTYNRLFDFLESLRPFTVKRKYLVYVAFQNLLIRKSRSLITIFGMSIGVAIIVFLLSLGYGIEKLVISQVASLEELQMIDVSAGESSTASLSKDAIKRMGKIEQVEKVIPFISVVGRLNYKNAKTDILVYGVSKDYFVASSQEIINGKNFSKSYNSDDILSQGQVAGESDVLDVGTYAKAITSYNIEFSPLPEQQVPVWKDCSIDSELLGFTTRTESDYVGMEYWGNEYAPFSNFGRAAYDPVKKIYLGKWIKGEFPIFKTKENNELAKVLDQNGYQEWKFGCIQRKSAQITQEIRLKGDVLGEATESATLTASASAELEEVSAVSEYEEANVSTNEAGLEVISFEQELQPEKEDNVLKFKSGVSGEAIVSTSLLNLLNISRVEATKEGFNISFIVIKSLMPSIKGRILTEEVTYKIVGVVDDEENQFIYIPIQDITNLGVENFSQAKVVLKEQEYLAEVRKSIESLGYKTASTADTIEQIETFFAGLRSVLGFIGFIALGVASLGMFNTLTVSLLERTREIGGMKTMGMVSGEIQELFLAEAMIMGFAGGIGGLTMGIVAGKLSSYAVSIIAIAQGVGYLELTFVPWSLILFIVISSFIVGLITGLYPSMRAKKISALNALRYE